ncbi:sigma-54-dependent Fis family transcriptional regulator [bacterium]|nr:sigma-54-dependent Fis family transcriptional regulator [bacterium]
MLKSRPKILIADQDTVFRGILVKMLEKAGYELQTVYQGIDLIREIQMAGFDLLLLDSGLQESGGMNLVDQIRGIRPDLPLVMISRNGSIQSAVNALKRGAADYIEKSAKEDRFLESIRDIFDKRIRQGGNHHPNYSGGMQDRMIGKSEAIAQIERLVAKASGTNIKVLIEGENGTGKELVARAIHRGSRRADRPFVAVNCAAIPENLVESELFGHKRGAFTGALSDKPGKFQIAHSGTLFLDEIGDMSLMTQAKVLRVIEEGVVENVGGRQPVPVDVRLIAATNQNLQKAMFEQRFREDLYFRLNVLNIQIPPLRERLEDIPDIAGHFVAFFCRENHSPHKRLSEEAVAELACYDWPGNVRELRNVIEKALVLVDAEEIQAEHIRMVMQGRQAGRPLANMTLKQARVRFEREFIRDKLAAANSNISRAAEMLGIPRTYLYKKIKVLDIPI